MSCYDVFEVSKMSLGSKIKEKRKRAKLTQPELAEEIGVSLTTLRRWEGGKTKPDSDNILLMAKILNTSTADLLGETDDPARPGALQSTSKAVVLPESNVRPFRGDLIDVPVLAPQSSVCCGGGFDLTEVEAEVDWWEPIPEGWLTGPRGDKSFFITHVEGDSMEPMIENGERILINPNQEVVHGDIALVCWNGRSMVRGVKFNRDRSVRLIPVNKAYDEDVISEEDSPYVLRYCGVVVRALGKDRVLRGIL